MKVRFFLLALTLLLLAMITHTGYAQSRGLYTGIALFPTLARSSEPGSLSKFSLNGELRIRLQLTDWFALESGPGFINHGFRYKTMFKDSVTQEEWTVVDPFQINYLTIPLRLRVIQNGFTFAAAVTPEIYLNSNPSRFSHQIRQRNAAWQVSAGYQIEMYGGGMLVLEFFHTQPFMDVFRSQKFQNTGLALNVIFPLMGPGGFHD